MSLIVMKFGGSAISSLEHIKNAASKVASEVQNGHKVAVVVSAMAGVTDQLIGYCRSITPRPNPREYDAVTATGEQITAGLFALALEQRGLIARSWQGWQIPIKTDSQYNNARIVDVTPDRVLKRLEEGEVAVLAGFQGISDDNSITTLGRGGSDMSAVALAAAIKADRCDIYTDVEGIFTVDPKIVTTARKLKNVSYEELLELASLGSKVLQTRSVEMAFRHGVKLQVLSTFANVIGSELQGTLIMNEDEKMEDKSVTGLAYSLDESKITLVEAPDSPGVAAKIFTAMAHGGVNVDMIVQAASRETMTTDITFTVPRADLSRALKILESEQESIQFTKLMSEKNVAKISLVGTSMRSRPGIASIMFETLAEKGINIQAIETSEISISVLIAEEYHELALRALHTAYDLDEETK